MSGLGPAAGPSSAPSSAPGRRSGSRSPDGLLQSLRRSEAKRLELERKQREYKKSDAYLMKLKYTKLKKYLKEVDDRQKGAVRRNQAFLKELDQFEAYMKASSAAMIQKMEVWYGREIGRVLSAQERSLSADSDTEAEHGEQVLQGGREAGTSARTAMPGGPCHPAFVGHHTSAISVDGSLGMWQKPPQPSESHLAPDPPSCSLSLEGLGLESRSADLETDTSAKEADRCEDVAASKKGSQQLISSASDPKPATPKEAQPQGSIPGPKPHLSNGWACKEKCESNDELLVLASAEDEEVVQKSPALLQRKALPVASCETDKDARAVEILQRPPNPPLGWEEPVGSSAPDGCRGMPAGLSPVLQLIEDVVLRTSPRHRALYQVQDVGVAGTVELLSFCNRAGSLGEADLEACEAAVLHQLQALLRRMRDGSLPPEKTLEAEGAAVDERQTRPDLLWDVDLLQTQLSDHALFLRKHQVPLSEEASGMFETLLASTEKVQDSQALLVLREALPEEGGNRSSVPSNEPTCSLPAIPDSAGGMERAKHAPQLTAEGEQGRDGGDSSANGESSPEESSDSGSSLKESRPAFSRTETRQGTITVMKSRAFWGESDDSSSSEIEAALRPQTQGTETDEFDDFYD